MKPPFWRTRLLEDERFAGRLADRWHELRAGRWSQASLEEIVDSAAGSLGEAQARNYVAWPVLGSDDPSIPSTHLHGRDPGAEGLPRCPRRLDRFPHREIPWAPDRIGRQLVDASSRFFGSVLP
jgi:hypothetical protein